MLLHFGFNTMTKGYKLYKMAIKWLEREMAAKGATVHEFTPNEAQYNLVKEIYKFDGDGWFYPLLASGMELEELENKNIKVEINEIN